MTMPTLVRSAADQSSMAPSAVFCHGKSRTMSRIGVPPPIKRYDRSPTVGKDRVVTECAAMMTLCAESQSVTRAVYGGAQ